MNQFENLPEQPIKNEFIVKSYHEIKLAVIDCKVDDESIYFANELTKKVRNLVKLVDETKKKEIEPLKAQIAGIEAPYKNIAGELKKLDDLLSSRILAYQSELRRKEQERLQKEREAQLAAMKAQAKVYEKQGDVENATAVKQAVQTVKAEPIHAVSTVKGLGATSTVTKRWTYEIIEPDAVPRIYCRPSVGKIMDAVRAGVREIKGVRIYEKEVLSIR